MSMFRLITLPQKGLQLINLTKVAVVELDSNSKIITYTMDNVKNNVAGGFIFFSGGDSKQYSAQYSTEEDAKKAFDEVKRDLESFVQRK